MILRWIHSIAWMLLSKQWLQLRFWRRVRNSLFKTMTLHAVSSVIEDNLQSTPSNWFENRLKTWCWKHEKKSCDSEEETTSLFKIVAHQFYEDFSSCTSVLNRESRIFLQNHNCNHCLDNNRFRTNNIHAIYSHEVTGWPSLVLLEWIMVKAWYNWARLPGWDYDDTVKTWCSFVCDKLSINRWFFEVGRMLSGIQTETDLFFNDSQGTTEQMDTRSRQTWFTA